MPQNKNLTVSQATGFDSPEAKQKAALNKALTAFTLPMRQGRGAVPGRGMQGGSKHDQKARPDPDRESAQHYIGH